MNELRPMHTNKSSCTQFHLQFFKQSTALGAATHDLTSFTMQRVLLTRMAAGNDRSATGVTQSGPKTKLFGYILVLIVGTDFSACTRGRGTLIY